MVSRKDLLIELLSFQEQGFNKQYVLEELRRIAPDLVSKVPTRSLKAMLESLPDEVLVKLRDGWLKRGKRLVKEFLDWFERNDKILQKWKNKGCEGPFIDTEIPGKARKWRPDIMYKIKGKKLGGKRDAYIFIECKDYASRRVKADAVMKMIEMIKDIDKIQQVNRLHSRAIIVSRTGFTKSAIDAAREHKPIVERKGELRKFENPIELYEYDNGAFKRIFPEKLPREEEKSFIKKLLGK